MSKVTHTALPTGSTPRRRVRWPIIPSLALLAILLEAALALTDSARAGSHRMLGALAYGRPFDWLVQDQTSADPPNYPMARLIHSPWENPTSIDAGMLLIDCALVFAVLAGGWLAVRRVRARA